MNETLGIILILAAIAGFIVWFRWKKKVQKVKDSWKKSVYDRANGVIKRTQPVVTPNGYKVYFEEGISNPSGLSLPAIDAGINKCVEKAICAGYAVDMSRHRVQIVSFNSIPDSQGDPAYKVYISLGNPYYDSEWDKEQGKGQKVDHYILAAAQMTAAGEPFGDIIVVPHHDGKESHLSTVVEYEMEHVLLAWHDGPKFEETKTHGSGQGHPLIPDCPSPSTYGLVGIQKEAEYGYKTEALVTK